MQDNGKRILTIVPAYNEQGAIRHVLQGVRQVLPESDILVVDDGSRDDTTRIAREDGATVIRHPFNLGIGGTVQTGMKYAKQMGYAYVVRIDGDGQHNAQDIPALLQPVLDRKADVSIGSRFLGKPTSMRIPLARRVGIRLFALEVSLLTGHRATDTTSGFMCLNRHAIACLADCLPQDYPEVEGRILMHRAHLRTVEVPARMQERIAGLSSINRWRSLYYAVKVSIAVLLTGIKEPVQGILAQEESHAAPPPALSRTV